MTQISHLLNDDTHCSDVMDISELITCTSPISLIQGLNQNMNKIKAIIESANLSLLEKKNTER